MDAAPLPTSTAPAPKPFVMLVTGSRGWTNVTLLEHILLAQTKDKKLVRLVHGGAKGADQLAHKLAIKQGWQFKVYTPEWRRLGKRAGPQRNSDMLAQEKIDLVVAFPMEESKGTWDMIHKARKAGARVVICADAKEN